MIADVVMKADFPHERWFWFDLPFHPGQSVLLHRQADLVYTFQCRRMEKFRHGRVLFVGDVAHQVSPFDARGGNSGIQDADNLAWKLRPVIAGQAPDALIVSHCNKWVFAADENIMNSTRSTDFITPKAPRR